MKKITMFIQPMCPYCKKALKYIEEAKANHPELASVEVEVHNELEETEFADSFDYYYVPTLFIGDKKIHEGGVFADEMVGLLRQAL